MSFLNSLVDHLKSVVNNVEHPSQILRNIGDMPSNVAQTVNRNVVNPRSPSPLPPNLRPQAPPTEDTSFLRRPYIPPNIPTVAFDEFRTNEDGSPSLPGDLFPGNFYIGKIQPRINFMRPIDRDRF